MNSSLSLKRLEKNGKKLLKRLLLMVLGRRNAAPLSRERIAKVLVFRLDQRIGNGVLLLPLLSAIRETLPAVELHYLIHHPVARLLEGCGSEGLITRIWPYHQDRLLRGPWRLWGLIRSLRREKFDLVLTSNNPDNFSLSQALFGRLLGARQLVGFDAKDSAAFYDLAVASSTRIHYSEAMVDLWRPYDGGAKMRLGALHPPEALREKIRRENPALGEKGIVLWLGATGNKILPGTVFAHLYEEIRSFSDLPVHFLAGPADEPHLLSYPAWVREKTVVWKAPLSETAALFSMHDYFISGDTGPMHLAAALNRRLLTLFVDSNLIQYGYRNAPLQEAIIWEDGPDGLVRLRKALGEMLGERPKPAGFASQNNRG